MLSLYSLYLVLLMENKNKKKRGETKTLSGWKLKRMEVNLCGLARIMIGSGSNSVAAVVEMHRSRSDYAQSSTYDWFNHVRRLQFFVVWQSGGRAPPKTTFPVGTGQRVACSGRRRRHLVPSPFCRLRKPAPLAGFQGPEKPIAFSSFSSICAHARRK